MQIPIAMCLTILALPASFLWAAVGVIAGLLLLVFFLVRRARRVRRGKPKWVVVDGSNVMYWKDNNPRIETVREVVDHLAASGFTPGVMFDANAGYLLTGRYEHDGTFEKLLNLPKDHVMVVNRGNPADLSILAAARDLGARIVTNDRYREWAKTYPEVRRPGHLIRGEYRNGRLWLDLGDDG